MGRCLDREVGRGEGADMTPKIAVACTLAGYKCEPTRDPMESEAWLSNIQAWRDEGHDIEVLAVLQTGQGHDDAFQPLLSRLAAFEAVVWTYSVDDGENSITSGTRIPYICIGRNLAHEFAIRNRDVTHLLLVDSDVEPPPDGLTKLLAINHPIVGGEVPTYGLYGPQLFCTQHRTNGTWAVFNEGGTLVQEGLEEEPFPEDAVIQLHWNTAGALLIQREAFLRLRWGWNPDQGMTDDPFFQNMAVDLGFGQTWVRKDSIWAHWPDCIGPLEGRGHDLGIVR